MLPTPHPDRKPLRLKEYDYSAAGAYYITLCVQNRECLFGEVLEGDMVLNAPGRMVQKVWAELPEHYPYIVLDTFVVMPNHVHGIIVIDTSCLIKPGLIYQTPTMENVGAQFIAPANVLPLGKIVRAFKAKSSFLINKHRQSPGLPVWQRGYYDHIIRNESDLFRIREYILHNPLNWELDSDHPKNVHNKSTLPYTNSIN